MLSVLHNLHFNIIQMYTVKKVDATLKEMLMPLFANHHRVDFGINSILEGQSGQQISVVVNNPENPEIAFLRYGTFGILAGDAAHPAAEALLQSIELPCAIQPSPEAWINRLQKKFEVNVKKIERFSFSHQHIDTDNLKELISKHPYSNAVQKIDTATAYNMENHEWNKYHLPNYNSPDDFANNGFAYAIKIHGLVASASSAALRCTDGIELNIITLPEFRNKGLAIVVAACTITKAIEQKLVPHWDAANQQSARLAARLGYTPAGSYYTHYITV